MTEQAKTNGTAIAPYMERTEVKEFGERIRKLMPGGAALTPAEAYSLAQVALAHGLDPFNKEIWYLKKKNGEPIGLHVGINGHRRAGRKQLEAEGGGNFWPEFSEPMSVDEKKAYGYSADAVVFRCKLYDSRTITRWTDAVSTLLKAGAPWDAVASAMGTKPYTPGIGVATPNEESRMDIARRAMKRAEADALKRRFTLPFGDDAPEVEPGEYIDGKATEVVSDYTDPAFVAGQIDGEKAKAEQIKADSAAVFGSE